MRKAIVLLISALLPALLLAATPDFTNLQVVVTNQNGKPVDNASVIIKFVKGRSAVKFGAKIRTEWEMKTTQQGIVKVPSIPQGKILVQVIAKNYQTFGQTYDVAEDEKTIEISLSPPQQQYTAH